MHSKKLLRPCTVQLLRKLMNPWVDHGVIYNVEANHIINNLNNLIRHNELMPPIPPKLLTQAEVAEMLGLGLSNFKKLEKTGIFPFKRRMLGGSVRYSNLSVIEYIKSTEFDVKEETDASKNQLSETEELPIESVERKNSCR